MNGNFTNGYTSLTDGGTITVANPENTSRHILSAFADIDATGFTESCILLWKVSRLASSDGLDDDSNACALLEFDIHYGVEKLGKDV